MPQALEGGDLVVTTGLILQELPQGFSGPRANKDIIDQFSALPFLSPDRQDPIDAAELRNKCRRSGVQAGTIDALLAQLCIRHGLVLLTTEKDFAHIALHCPLVLWKPLRYQAPNDGLRSFSSFRNGALQTNERGSDP